MDNNDLIPFPNEVVSTLIEVVSFLRKPFVRLIAQQTIEPHDSCVFIDKGTAKILHHIGATNPTLLHAYSLLINSKPFSLFLYYFTPYVFVEGFRREDPRKNKDHAFRHLTVPQIYTHGRIYLCHLFVASDLPPT